MFTQSFNQDSEFSESFVTCSHLRDRAIELGADTGFASALSEDLEQEQLASIQAALLAAIAEQERQLREEELSKISPCYIGPYANRICTICGGRQP